LRMVKKDMLIAVIIEYCIISLQSVVD
jgi:hypothetical protein